MGRLLILIRRFRTAKIPERLDDQELITYGVKSLWLGIERVRLCLCRWQTVPVLWSFS